VTIKVQSHLQATSPYEFDETFHIGHFVILLGGLYPLSGEEYVPLKYVPVEVPWSTGVELLAEGECSSDVFNP